MSRFERRAEYVIGGLLMAAATLQAWAHRFFMHPDGLSYIDIATAYARGDFAEAINSSWSPLTAWLYIPFIAAGLPRSLEPAVFHLLNLPILLFAFVAFVFIARMAIADAYARTLALIVFAWSQLELMPLSILGGDRLASAFLFLGVALLLRNADDEEQPARAIAAGAAFGLAYLAKAIMLPLALVTLPLFALRRARRSAVLAAVTTLLVATPWIAVLSSARGHFTYSEVGELSYAWDVIGIPRNFYHGDPARETRLTHPPRVLVDSPRVHEFATPFDATYALHYEPAYWYEGMQVERSAGRQLSVVAGNFVELLKIVWPLLLSLAGLWLIAVRRTRSRHVWLLLWPAAVGIGAYCLRHIEPRYIAPFVALGAVAVLAPLQLGRNRRTVAVAALMTIALFIAPARRLALDALAVAGHDRRFISYRDNPQVVAGLRAAGLGAGDRIATIGDRFFAHNARIVGARVVAEMDSAGSAAFWQVDEPTRQQVYERLRTVGVDAVVADRGDAPGWRPIPHSALHMILLEGP